MGGSELIGKEEKEALCEVIDRGAVLLRYGFDSQRKSIFRVREFEEKFASYAGSKYALAVSSGSASLHAALKAMGVGPGDEVITQAFTFVASAEAVIEAGATPVICDVDKSLNLDPEDFRQKITGKTKAVMPVHMLGAAADLDEITRIAGERGIAVLEDSCQACGSAYKGRKTGSLGLMGCFSFDYVKTITTGEGGMIVTDDENLYKKASEYHDHGHEHRTDIPRGMDTRTFPGFNFRMSELAGALGLVQLGRLERVLADQRKNKKLLKSKIDGNKAEFRLHHDEAGDGGDTLIFFLENCVTAARVEKSLSENGIPTKILPSALDWHFAGRWKHMRDLIKPENGEWKKTEELLNRAIAIPISVNMEEDLIQSMADAVNGAL